MNGGPSGFHNAPVTRNFVIGSALLTIVLGVQARSPRLGLSYQDIFEEFQLWRVISSVFAFSSTPELMFGLYLLYYFRVFERQLGSNKHSVFISFSVVMSLLLEVIALSFLKDSSLNRLASGPYGLIFASFVPFYFDIPVSSRFRVFGINFTDKSFVYLAGLQLLLSSWKCSLVPGVCGLIAGALYHFNIFGIRRMKVIYSWHLELSIEFLFSIMNKSYGLASAWRKAGRKEKTVPKNGSILFLTVVMAILEKFTTYNGEREYYAKCAYLCWSSNAGQLSFCTNPCCHARAT